MENLPIDSCVMTAGPAPKMNDKTCQSLSFASLGSLIVGAGDSSNIIVPTAGKQMKFSLTDFKEIEMQNVSGFQATTFDSSTCSCDNVVLEAHYKAYFTNVLQ